MSAVKVDPQKLHIVHLANFYGPRSGGLRTTLHAIGRGYREAGHRFSVIVPGERNRLRRLDFGDEYQVAAPVVPGTGGYRMILRRATVLALLNRLAPDRIELSDRTSLHPVGRWARRRGIRTVFFAHERLDGIARSIGLPTTVARTLADARNRCTARDFDTLVATTTFAADEFVRIGATHLRHVPLGVDLQTFRPVNQSSRPAGNPRSADPLRLILCSRLSVEKAPDLAVRALIDVRRHGVDAELTILGDGPRRGSLEALADGHPVEFVGFVSDRTAVAAALATADIAIAPGPIETFGLAALECLAAGTSVVVNRSSALPEVLGHDPAAGAVAGPSPADFAQAVLRLAAVPAAERRAAARARAEQFPWAATVSALLRIHQGAPAPLLEGHRR